MLKGIFYFQISDDESEVGLLFMLLLLSISGYISISLSISVAKQGHVEFLFLSTVLAKSGVQHWVALWMPSGRQSTRWSWLLQEQRGADGTDLIQVMAASWSQRSNSQHCFIPHALEP